MSPSIFRLITTTRIGILSIVCCMMFFQTHVVSDVNTTSYMNITAYNESQNVCTSNHTDKCRTCKMVNHNGWLGKVDPSSFSNPDEFRTVAIKIVWTAKFDTKIISGSVTHEVLVLNSHARQLTLDTRDLNVSKVVSVNDGKQLAFTIGNTKGSFGEPLYIPVTELAEATGVGNTFKIEIFYKTSPNSTGLQWLDPLQTAGKKHPYLFSQCQAIHARSILPCQDTPFVKATYSAEVSAPKELQVLMSAIPIGDPKQIGENKVYQFKQDVPIPCYLFAIAIGNLVSRRIGPRSNVWAEPEFVDAATFEFSETENMIKAAEHFYGEYVWGIYDILVLPPSFPFGGMENPCLTFATPTLLAGDRSLANVIAHEICHSWTGNLVTNTNWEHFWLNEGWTVFVERKIIAAMTKNNGEQLRQLMSIEGWDDLSEHNTEVKPDNPLTRLVVDLNEVDPDDAFSIVPYEKGNVLLFYLETKVGREYFEEFLKVYIQKNKFKSIDSNIFKSQFLEYFHDKGMSSKIADVDWDTWFCSPGMPIFKPEYDQTLALVCTNLSKKWIEWDPATPMKFAKSDFDGLSQPQKKLFLQLCIAAEPFSVAKIQAMKQVYEIDKTKNSEIRFRWIRLCIRARDISILLIAFEFLNEQGRMKFCRPLYRDLCAWEEVRNKTIKNFNENSKFMMHVTAKMISQDLQCNK